MEEWMLLAASLPLFFWVRGIVRGSKGDLAAGALLVIVISFLHFAAVGHSGAFCGIGSIVVFWGIGTLVGGSFAKPECPLKRDDRIWLGVFLIVVGLFVSSIV